MESPGNPNYPIVSEDEHSVTRRYVPGDDDAREPLELTGDPADGDARQVDKAGADTKATKPAPATPPRFTIVNAAKLLGGGLPPPLLWLVPWLIPAGEVTLLSGDGGTGKSLLALQFAVATVAGSDWIGSFPERGRVLFLSAEDDIDELHRRLADIARHQHLDADALTNLDIVPLAGLDAVLASPKSREGELVRTPLFEDIRREIETRKPDLLILDTLSDLFAGDEIKRQHARQFIGMLKGLAIKYKLTVLLLSHPSLSGMASGKGTSGSTAWNASVRSRLYFERPNGTDEDEESDERILRCKKSNRGPIGGKIALRWCKGVFVLNNSGRLETDVVDDRVFLDTLAEFSRSGSEVSRNLGRTYAPALFAKSPAAKGLSKDRLEAAMERLFTANKIHNRTEGPPSKQRRFVTAGPASLSENQPSNGPTVSEN